MNTLLLDALQCNNKSRPPVWLMRQAGRYMPEYRALRAQHSLSHLFHTPELAAQVTLQPVELLGVDAAIVFSDILVIAEVFGQEVVFPEGKAPQVLPKLTPASSLSTLPVQEILHYVKTTIELLKPNLKVPLIGFCGGPFTLATYMTQSATEWLSQDPKSFHLLLDTITQVLIDYLKMQIHAGVDVVQIFDSWASLLTPSQFQEFSQAYLGKIVAGLKETGVPVILFCRGSSLYPQELSSLAPAAISFDSAQEIAKLRAFVPRHIAVQGNLDPEWLQVASISEVIAKTQTLLNSMRGDPGFIANLGHGVLPKTPVDNVRAFIDTIKTSL